MAQIFKPIIFLNIINCILLSKEEFIENPIKINNDTEIDNYIIDENKYLPLEWFITFRNQRYNPEIQYENNLII